MSGRVVVVAGGTGVVGSAIAEELLRRGARVIVPTRRADAHVPEGARRVVLADWEEPVALHAAFAERGWTPHAAVAAVGGWSKGVDLVDLPVARWRQMIESHLTAHFLVARALLPVLVGEDPVHVMLNGAAAEQPMPGSGAVNVTGAGQAMLLDVLRAEAIGARVRLHEVRVMHAVVGDERNEDPGSTAEPDAVARAVLDAIGDPGSEARIRL